MNDEAGSPRGIAPESWTEPPGFARAVALGCLVGAVIAFVVVTPAMMLMDVEWESAAGLGVFVAFWGGLGFGAMVAGVLFTTNRDSHA